MSEILERIGNEKVEWKRLGDVCEIVTDYVAAGSFKSIADNVKYLSIPDYAQLVRTRDIKSNFENTESFVYVDESAFKFLYRVNLDRECLVLPNVGNCGEIYYIKPEKLPYKNNVLGPNAIFVRSEFCKIKFLYYLFLEKYFQDELYKITSKTGQGKFNKTDLKQILIPIPSLETQEKIVKILDKFQKYASELQHELQHELQLRIKHYEYYRDLALSEVWLKKQIELLNKYIKGEITLEERKYENYRNLIFDELLKLEYTTIGEISEGGLTYGSGTTSKEYDGKTRYIRITDIDEDGGLKEEKVSPSIIEEKYLLEEGDILLARSGASVGKNYIHEVEERAVYAGYLIRLRVNKEKAIPKYVYYTLNSTSYKKFVENKKRVSSQPNINAKEYSNIKITLPPLMIQKRVVDVLDKLEEMVNNTKGLLPHEIELRRKQYEYYREKLLTFEAKYDSQSVSQSVR